MSKASIQVRGHEITIENNHSSYVAIKQDGKLVAGLCVAHEPVLTLATEAEIGAYWMDELTKYDGIAAMIMKRP